MGLSSQANWRRVRTPRPIAVRSHSPLDQGKPVRLDLEPFGYTHPVGIPPHAALLERAAGWLGPENAATSAKPSAV